MINARERFAWFLRAEMEKKGWGKADLARESGVSKMSIWRYLEMKSSPKIEEIAFLCEALGCTASQLCGF